VFKAPTSFNIDSLAIIVIIIVISKWAYTLGLWMMERLFNRVKMGLDL